METKGPSSRSPSKAQPCAPRSTSGGHRLSHSKHGLIPDYRREALAVRVSSCLTSEALAARVHWGETPPMQGNAGR